MKKRSFLFTFLFLNSLLAAQKEGVSSFSAVTLIYKFHPKYFFYAEGQLRGYQDYMEPDYYEVKAGLGYNLSKYHKPLIGIGQYGYYKDRVFDKREFQIWVQDVVDLKVNRFKFENRFRAEKSWFYEPQKDAYSDRIRLRYRLNISVPLNSKKVEKGTISANVYDEIYFTTNKSPLFTRNIIYAGTKYQIDENFALALGYHFQREFARTGNRNYHFIYLGLNVSIDDFSQKTDELKKPD